jgi:hypothetical protein
VLRPRLKLECLSSKISLLVLSLTYDCTEMSADGIWKQEPCPESRGALPEAGEDYEGSEMEVLGTMTAAKFDVDNNKVIDLKSKKYRLKCFR